MWELDYKESWATKNCHFWTVVLEKALEIPLASKEIKPVNAKGNQPWIFIRRTDAEAEVLILWPPDVKSWLIGKDLDAGEDWGQEEKGPKEEEMVGWHHWLNGHEFEQTQGYSDGQGSLVGAVHAAANCQTQLSAWTTTTVRQEVPICGPEVGDPWTKGIQHFILKYFYLNYPLTIK